MHETIISCEELNLLLSDPDTVVVDTRSKQSVEQNGERAYSESHIPGAVYANLDRHLAAPHEPGKTGRHPLPSVEEFAGTLSFFGIDGSKQVVVYDDMSGAYAARLWWMLRWMGHDSVAVLDGGWQRWVSEGRETTAIVPSPAPATFVVDLRSEMVASVADVDRVRSDKTCRLLDARSADRFRGENETLDPVAGHIQGAQSFPFVENLNADGLFKSKAEIRALYAAVSDLQLDNLICYCGSGVTAAHNILSMVDAGLPEPRLYVGSWSHWITDRSRSIG